MSGIFASLQIAGNALAVQSRSLQVVQNNLLNATTPGYARQTLTLHANAFSPAAGLLGGVSAGAVMSSRSEFAESSVRNQNSLLQRDRIIGQLLKGAGTWLDGGSLTAPSGLTGAFESFSDAVRSWAGSPSDAIVRQRVITEAEGLARGFRDAAAGVAQARQDAIYELGINVSRVNQILADLERIQQGFTPGELQQGAEAAFYAGLEELSRYLDFMVVRSPQGLPTVTTAGGALLLSGNRAYPLSVSLVPPPPGAPFADALPSVELRAADGSNITASVKAGRIGGFLEALNQIYPSLIGDGSQQGALNRLAEAFAARVNAIVASGRTLQDPPVPAVPLFQLGGSGTGAASGLRLNPAVTPANLATLAAAGGSDDRTIPARLVALVNISEQREVMQPENRSYRGFLYDLSMRISGATTSANRSEQVHAQVLEQALAIRERVSGVSLEQEAVAMLQFQRSFESITKIISVLDEMVQATLQLVR